MNEWTELAVSTMALLILGLRIEHEIDDESMIGAYTAALQTALACEAGDERAQEAVAVAVAGVHETIKMIRDAREAQSATIN